MLPPEAQSALDDYCMNRYNMSAKQYMDANFDKEFGANTEYRYVRSEDRRQYDLDRIEELEDDILNEIGVKIKIEEAFRVRIYFETKDSGNSSFREDEWDEDHENVEVYKVDGKWYIWP